MAVASQSTAETEIYTDLGLVPVINARGNQTLLGGSTVPDEVQEAIDAANRYYVVMEDLFAATGRVIADSAGMRGGLRDFGLRGSAGAGRRGVHRGR